MTATREEQLAPAGDTILELHRSGRLAADYPWVKSALSELSGAGLLRAGQILARLSADDVLARHPSVPAVRIAVTGHGTLAALVPALTAQLARHGMLLRPVLGDFDSWIAELSDPHSALLRERPGIVLCVLDPTMVADELPAVWRPADVERVLDEKLLILDRLSARFADAGAGTLVLNTLPLPGELTRQLVDYRSRAALGAIWRQANARLLQLSERHPDLVVVDMDPLVAEGISVRDPRLSIYTKAHLSTELLARYAREIGHLARHLTGRLRKCLVLDLDETVWGGVLGDDGADGIEVAETYRGEAFAAFQRVIKQIGSQGVLVAAVSKNDVEPVRQVLREHPQMTLREEDFTQVIANWQPKQDNLRELAAALNLGLDSFVFVDDSPYECGLVRHELPEVSVVPVGAEPALHISALLADGWFDARELTTEDRNRPALYREELARSDFLQEFSSLQDYLRELGVHVALAAAEHADVARVSQLTLRTNQFNLTGTRLQPDDITERMQDPAALVLTIRAQDRFGDNGMVGTLLARWEPDALRIENMLLSCRVFARGIEQTCLLALLRYARDAGAPAVVGCYQPTPKNQKVHELYPRLGFEPAGERDGTQLFRHDLTVIAEPPDHVTLTDRIREAHREQHR